MKPLSSLFILIIGIAVFTAKAQEADSVTVIYDNQKTVIPVPKFGKRTTIKMADSIQDIEIAVSRSSPSDSLFPTNKFAIKNPKKKTKWFSQVEAGYIIGLVDKGRFPLYTSSPSWVFYVNNDPLPGFSLGLSVFDRERILDRKFSYDIGLKFGIVDQFRIQKPKTEIPYDSINQILNTYIDYGPYTITSLQLVMPAGMRYSFGSGKAISKISLGVNIGISFNFLSYKADDNNWESRYSFSMSPIVQTYIGYEYRKIGILGTVEFTSLGNLFPQSEIRYKVGLSMTYRFF